MSNFTWIPIYKELSARLLEYENRQNELLDIIKKIASSGIPVIPMQDKPSANETAELTEIDPFTFYSSFNRGITNDNRKQILAELKKIFALKSDLPDDFDGIPVMTNQKSWLFAYKYERGENDIKLLWQLFREAVTEEITENTFNTVLNIKGVKINITIGLFWIMPDKYLSLDSVMKEYTKEDFDKLNYGRYLEKMEAVKTKFNGKSFEEISYDAWNLKQNKADSRIEKTLNSIIPDKTLQIKILKCLAESIMKANESDPAGWCVRLKSNEFYLVTGSPYCLAVKKDSEITLLLDKPSLTEDVIGRIDKFKMDWDVASVSPKEDNYPLSLKFNKLPEIYDLTRNSHFRFIERAARPQDNRRNHDADFVEYIEKVTGVTLPIPSYYNMEQVESKMNKEKSYNSKMSLNTILYGPPGTGKTYNVINKAVEIIDGQCSEDRGDLLRRYNELKDIGQIDFITFHQSFSYEEFIEGIKPENNVNGNLEYTINDGVFKSICTRAKIRSTSKTIVYDFDENKINFFKMSLGNSQDDGDDIARYCFENNVIAMGYGRNIDFSNAKTKEEIDKLYSQEKDEKIYPAQAVDRFKNWMKINDIVIVSSGNHKVSAIGKVTGDYFFDNTRPIDFKHYRKVEWLYKDAIIPVDQILNNKVFSQQTIYEFYKKDLNMTNIKSLISTDETSGEIKPFVLIIDEINRGNISKIFGELITLIEEDKRLGAENELTVTLPYSKEKFGVPSNLYIVGTMNTADRSIALMDTALRRRFTFVEMMPDLSTLDGLNVNGIDIKAMLSKMNERIEFLYDRDHTIGHAYFIGLKNISDAEEQYAALCGIFSTKIIPLLQEYFYEDWEKIQLVLDDHYKQLKGGEKDTASFEDDVNKARFIQSRLFSENAVLGFDHEDYEDRVTYRVNPSLNDFSIDAEAFIKIYRAKA